MAHSSIRLVVIAWLSIILIQLGALRECGAFSPTSPTPKALRQISQQSPPALRVLLAHRTKSLLRLEEQRRSPNSVHHRQAICSIRDSGRSYGYSVGGAYTRANMASSSSTDNNDDDDDNQSGTPLDSCCPPQPKPQTDGDLDETTTTTKKMRVSEIKGELDDLGVSYVDCFDRESLYGRLLEARKSTTNSNSNSTTNSNSNSNDGDPTASNSCCKPNDTVEDTSSEDKNDGNDSGDQCCPNPTADESKPSPSTPSPSPPPAPTRLKTQAEALTFLRSQRARELRILCSEAGIRWGTIVEKEELVQLLLRHREAAASFSSSGTLAPGRVTDVDDTVLMMEINGAAASSNDDGGEGTDAIEIKAPLLVDVYATWCGPCQMMAPELDKVAKELGDTLRLVKMDSDKYPQSSMKLGVQAFPTLILFEGGGTGKELKRIEGGMAAGDLIQMIKTYL